MLSKPRTAPLRTLLLRSVAFLAAAALSPLTAQNSLHISEFMATNETTLSDEDGEETDWIEIRNGSSQSRSLNGWYLTDDANDLEKWRFPAVTVPAGGFLLVFASGKDRHIAGAELHANFKLNKNGEYLALVQSNGTSVASEYAPVFPEQFEDIAYGLNSSGAKRFFDAPTPGSTNAGSGFEGVVSSVWFSHERGFYSSLTSVNISASPSDATIRYTLDGSAPTQFYGSIYTGPLALTQTTVLRVLAYRPGYISSDVETHTYLSLQSTLEQPESVPGYPQHNYDIGSGNATVQHDYEMDPAIVASQGDDLLEGLTAIPTVSIAAAPWHIFGNSGFYDGTDVERPVSIEVIYPNEPHRNHQANAGIESHSHKRLKRSLRLNFRNEYGDAKFHTDLLTEAPLNGEGATDTVDRLILRGGNNRSWARNWNPGKTTYAIDQFFRDSQIAMTGIGAHGTFAHLYINGLYWGLYNVTERPDKWFTSTYMGGDEDDWFAMNHGGDLSGNDDRYDYLTNSLVNKDMSDPSKYAELQQYLNVENFIDYVSLAFWMGLGDWPTNNFYGGNRNGSSALGATPHQYFAWDGEWCFDAPFGFSNAGQRAHVHPDFRSNKNGGPTLAALWHAARDNDEFMLRFADRVHRNVHNDGPLSDASAIQRWDTLNNVIEDAILAESARWGDALASVGHPKRTRSQHWQPQVAKIRGLMAGNADVLIDALRDEGFYPSIDAPVFAQHGGSVPSGYALTMTTPDGGTIYFTADGSDPRLAGGGVAPSAQSYGGPVPLGSGGTIHARVRKNGTWSAMTSADFFSGYPLRISEFLASNQTGLTDESGDYDDWVEIYNAGAATVHLEGLYLTDQLQQPLKWALPSGVYLGPDERLVIWADASPQEGPLHANFKLAAGGEELGLFFADGGQPTLIHGFAFGPQGANISSGTLPAEVPLLVSFFAPSPGASNVPLAGQSAPFDAPNPNQNAVALKALNAPVAGQTLIFEVTAAPSTGGLLALGQVPVVFPTTPADTLLVLPDSAELWPIFLTNSAGKALVTIDVPQLPALVGHAVYFQAAVEPFTFSNGVVATFGG